MGREAMMKMLRPFRYGAPNQLSTPHPLPQSKYKGTIHPTTPRVLCHHRPSTSNIAQPIQALDRLEIAASTNSILRRYHLTHLVDHRNERERHHNPAAR